MKYSKEIVTLIFGALFSILWLGACSKISSGSGGTSQTPIILQGNYCTVSTLYTYLGPNIGVNPFAVVCLQRDGNWKIQTEYNALPTFDYPTEAIGGQHGCYQPAFAQAANGDLLVSFVCDNASTWESRFNSNSGWQAPVRLETMDPQLGIRLSGIVQYGPFITEYMGLSTVLWNTSQYGPTVSFVNNGNVNHELVLPPSAPYTGVEDCYSLDSFIDPDNGDFYVYCGGVRADGDSGPVLPRVLKRQSDGSYLSLPSVPASNPNETTQYVMLSKWNGQLVMAYSSADLVDFNWYVNTWSTHVAVYNGTNWQIISSQLEDTPGHEGTRPFVFSLDGDLLAIYFDYTTEGVPTEDDQIYGRYRIKKWDGNSWQLIPGESESVFFTQRNEFLNDNGQILFGAVRYNQNRWEKIMLGWSAGQWSVVGNPVKTCPQYAEECDVERPGAVIKLH